MNYHRVLVAVLLAGISLSMHAQPARSGGSIRGTILDAREARPIEYAEIVLIRDGEQLTGTISDAEGKFEIGGLRPGPYSLEIQFLSYASQRVDEVNVSRAQPSVDLGDISLEPDVIHLDAVRVEGERAPVSYQIDRKVIQVDQHLNSVSGSAVDVLENVPSVTVDIEGNVSLRGSSNFRVLVDGRPTVLEASDALQQIPASSIENIEIITNPSAKYDPEGTAGIINVVLKKHLQSGRSGIINMNAGLNDKYGGDALLEHKGDGYGLTLGIDYDHRFSPGESLVESSTTTDGETFFVDSEGDSRWGRERFSLRGGVDFELTPTDRLLFGGRFGDFTAENGSDLAYDEWSETDPLHDLYTSTMDRERSGRFYAVNGSYEHLFARKGHRFTLDGFYSYRDSDEETTNELITPAGVVEDGQRSLEAGPGTDLRLKMDYVHPLAENQKVESGIQSDLDRSEDETHLLFYLADSGDFVVQPEYSNITDYERDIHAGYLIYGGEWSGIGLQGGLRVEFTDRLIRFGADEEEFGINRWDYFPSLHTSYQLPGGQQMMASYSRRIDRPRGWHLEPFETWMDAFNVRVGNPGLKPEYIDSYEMGYQLFFGRNLFSSELYYRRTDNKIERVRSAYDENTTLHSMMNIGRDEAIGAELLLNWDLRRWWNVNLLGNLYQYRLEGTVFGADFDRSSFNWSGRVANSIKAGPALRFQFDANYQSPTVTSQGRREGFVTINAAIRYDIILNQLSATLQARDLFSSSEYEFTSEGIDYYSYTYSTRESPQVMLNLQWNLNRPKTERRREDQGDSGGMEEF